MSELNNLNVEIKDDVLLSTINRAWQGEFGRGFQGFESAERAMKIIPAHILRSCLILKRLGLVKRDDNHAFGYKPRRHLMPLLSRNLKHPILLEIERDYAHPEETDCFYCIYEAAVPCKVRWPKIDYHPEEKVLHVLGLATWTTELDAVPTRRLRRLAARIRNEARGIESGYNLEWLWTFGKSEKAMKLYRKLTSK